jgi:hypothetical protein
MTRFWGDDSWRQVAWADSKQPDMFSVTELEKQPNKVIAEAFREWLKKVADLPPMSKRKKRGNNPAGHCRGAVPPGQA